MSPILLILLLGGVLGAVVFAPLWDAKRARTEQERAVTIRLTLFTWLLGGLMVLCFLVVPDKHRVLMLVPLFFGAVLVGRVWKRARLRARQKPGVDFERMKRVN